MKKRETVLNEREKRSSSILEADRADVPINSRDYTVTIVGLGYVGLPLALEALRSGFHVQGVDVDRGHIEALQEGKVPSSLEEHDAQFLQKQYREMTFAENVVHPSDAFIVCVPTPVREDKSPDLTPLIGATELIAPHIRRGSLVVIESTVNPGVCEECVLPILEKVSGLRVERDFFFAHCPERINPGDQNWNVATIPRVLGTVGKRSDQVAFELYRSIIKAPIMLMKSVKEAEAVKMVENSFRDINIAFVNELAMSFRKAGIDTLNVLKGASTKPFGFMTHYPGCGVGGHCIPVDPYYLIAYGHRNGFNHRFLEVAREINNQMPAYTVELLKEQLEAGGRHLAGSQIALLGLSYKKDVPDLRESPALEIERELEKQGAIVRSYDPLLPDRSSAKSLTDALLGSVGVIVATNHSAFEMLRPEALKEAGVRVLIDGRNCLHREPFESKGIEYIGIGR